jgi:hypothetical protein
MSNALLDKARAILAHPKQRPLAKADALDVKNKNNEISLAELAIPTSPPSGTLPPTALSSVLTPDPKSIHIEPAPLNAKGIYWETGTGRILGPAIPEFLARDGDSFWISTTFQQTIWWINADRLRSKKAFLEQREVKEVELIRSF